MLKISIITNTWKCDSCGEESVTELNPYYRIYISHNPFTNSPNCEIDLCDNCIVQITTQSVIDWISNNG